jgi:hypothetical protein
MHARLLIAAALLASGAAVAQPVTRFDGTWRGQLTATPGSRAGCPSTGNRTMVVRRGEAEFGARADQTLTGRVAADGSVNLSGPRGGNTRVTGQFQGDRFEGEYRTPNCVSALALTRQR